MPIIKSAIKKLRVDRRRTARNKAKKSTLKEAIKGFRKAPGKEALPKLQSLLDKAAKTNLIHKNKAARLKSRLARLLGKTKPASIPPSREKKSKLHKN